MYKLYLIKATTSVEAVKDYLLPINCPLIKYIPFEQTRTWLNIVLLILTRNLSTRTLIEKTANNIYIEILQDIEIKPIENEFVSFLSDRELHLLATSIKCSQTLYQRMLNYTKWPINSNQIIVLAYTILSLLDTIKLRSSQLLTSLNRYPNECKCGIMLCILQIMRKQKLNCKQIRYYLENIWKYIQPYQPKYLRYVNQVSIEKICKYKFSFIFHFRLSTAMMLTIASENFTEAVIEKNTRFLNLFITYILYFLMDEEEDIRKFVSQLILHQFCSRSKLTWIPRPTSNISYPVNLIAIKSECVVPMVVHELFLLSIIDILVNFDIDDSIIMNIFENTITSILEFSQAKLFSTDYDANNFEICNQESDQFYAEPMMMIRSIFAIFSSFFQGNIKIYDYINNFMDKMSLL